MRLPKIGLSLFCVVLLGVAAYAGAPPIPPPPLGFLGVGMTWNSTTSGSATTAGLVVAPVWNTSGVVDAALLVNPTNTASGVGSLLADFQVGGVSKVTVDSTGNVGIGNFATARKYNGFSNNIEIDDQDGFIQLATATFISWGQSSDQSLKDTFIRKSNPATITFGDVDSAAPVAQATTVQNVVAGTSNTAGVKWTHKDSAGTGTGATGGFEFQDHPPGTTGSSQNAAACAFQVSVTGSGLVTLCHAWTTSTIPACAAGTAYSLAAVSDGSASPTYNAAYSGGGSSKRLVFCDGSSWTYH